MPTIIVSYKAMYVTKDSPECYFLQWKYNHPLQKVSRATAHRAHKISLNLKHIWVRKTEMTLVFPCRKWRWDPKTSGYRRCMTWNHTSWKLNKSKRMWRPRQKQWTRYLKSICRDFFAKLVEMSTLIRELIVFILFHLSPFLRILISERWCLILEFNFSHISRRAQVNGRGRCGHCCEHDTSHMSHT